MGAPVDVFGAQLGIDDLLRVIEAAVARKHIAYRAAQGVKGKTFTPEQFVAQ